MGIWYTTRESVKDALDIKATARSDAQVDRAIESASRAVEGLLHRRFYPWSGTRTFDWPGEQRGRPWRLWLNQHELISVTTLTAGGTTIGPGDYFLRPDDGPPFTHVEIDLDSAAAFSAAGTHQRAISITGAFGHSADTTPAGATAEALDAAETGADVTDSAAIGVGDIIKVDDERMIVTGKAMLTTGQTLQTQVGASAADTTIAVSNGALFTADEVILLDAERMRVLDIAANNLIVKRQWDGTALAAHNGATIYAPRTLTVTRGALGTTAATHLTAAPITRHLVPGPVAALTVAYALNTLLQQSSGYARVAGSGENAREFTGRGIKDIERDAVRAYGRQARARAV